MLSLAQDNPLLHAVVSATHGADTELLPLLTTHSSAPARGRQDGRDGAGHGLPTLRLSPAASWRGAIDMVVRVVLSHVMQPSGEPGSGPPPTWPSSPGGCSRAERASRAVGRGLGGTGGERNAATT